MKKLLFFFFLLFSVCSYAQQYHGTAHIQANDAIGYIGKSPADARTMFYDSVHFRYRPFQSVGEALSYLVDPINRFGNGIIVIDSGGVLQSNGTFFPSHNTFYMWADTTSNAGLVKLNLFGTSGPCAGCLLASNNLTDLASIPTSRATLLINNVDNTSDASKNSANVTITNHIFSGLSNTFSNIPNSALSNNSIGLSITSNAGSDISVTTTPAALGTSLVANIPTSGPSTRGALSSTNWNTFNNKQNPITLTIAGFSGPATFDGTTLNIPQYAPSPSCLNCNADSLKHLPVDTSSNRNGYILAFDSVAHKWYLTPNAGSGSGITQLTGDGTAGPGSGSQVLTLATVNSNVGTFGSASTVPQITLNGKGLSTAASSVAIQIAESQVTNLVTDLAAKQTTTLTSGNILVGNGSNVATSVTPSGDWTINNTGVNVIGNNKITYAKIQAASGQSLLGATGAGNFGEITLGSNLSMSGSVLNASGAVGSVSNSDGTLTISPTTGVVVASLALGHANTWSALQTFGTLTTTGATKLTGTASGASTDSILTINPSTGLVTWRNGTPFTLFAVQGLQADGTSGDSIALGGSFYRNDTIATNGHDFLVTGLPHKTYGSTDSSLIQDNTGKLYKVALPSLTTTGTSGAATFSPLTGIFNIPQYQGAGNYITSLTTDVVATGPGAAAATIQPNVVTYSKIQAAAGQGLMGATGAANFGLITLGSNLSMSGSVLNATGPGGIKQVLIAGRDIAPNDSIYMHYDTLKFYGGGAFNIADTFRLIKDTVIYTGDSWTTGLSSAPLDSSYVNLHAHYINAYPKNLGVSGQTTTTMIANTLPLVPTYKPCYRYITEAEGINDEGAGLGGIGTYKANLITIIDTFIARGYPKDRILVFSPGSNFVISPTIGKPYSDTAMAVAAELGVVGVDQYDYMVANGGASLIDGVTFHPNNAGHNALFNNIINTVKTYKSANLSVGGNIGINTSRPYHNLDVRGDGRFSSMVEIDSGMIWRGAGNHDLTNWGSGFRTLASNTTGISNTAFGSSALYLSTSSSYNTAVGNFALYTSTGSNNSAFGAYASNVNTSGSNNTGLGGGALQFNSTGSDNVAVGANTGLHNTTANGNTSIGSTALPANTTGTNNFAGGFQALLHSTTASYNTALGATAMLLSTTADHSVGVGYGVWPNLLDGTTNTGIGYQTGGGIVHGSYNTIVGANITGLGASLSNNIILGDGQGNIRAQWDASGNMNTTAQSFITDTTANKPLTQDASGNLHRATSWYGSTSNIYNTDGSLTGNRILSGASHNLTLGVNSSSPIGNFSADANLLTLQAEGSSGTNIVIADAVTDFNNTAIHIGAGISSETDANVTVLSTGINILLPIITANRTLTMPAASSHSGRILTLTNANTAGFTWSFAGSNVKDIYGNTLTTIPNGSVYSLVADQPSATWIAYNIQQNYNSTVRYAHTIFTPTTGGTVSLVNNQYNIINPAGALVALTVNLPSSPANNDVVYIKFTQNVTTVTYANGTVADGITAPSAGGLTILVFDSSANTWY